MIFKLHQQDPKDQRNAGVASQSLRLVNPELGNSGDKNKKTKQKFLRRLFLLAGKDQGGQTADKATENQEADGPCTFESFRKLAIGDRSPGFAAGHAFANKPAALEEVPHRETSLN